jgi:hypothetical protein
MKATITVREAKWPSLRRNDRSGVAADVIYDSDGADEVAKALANAVKTSVAHIDSLSANSLKAGLAEAQSGMGG